MWEKKSEKERRNEDAIRENERRRYEAEQKRKEQERKDKELEERMKEDGLNEIRRRIREGGDFFRKRKNK